MIDQRNTIMHHGIRKTIPNACDILYDNYLAHYGIIGMHWGVRRYQNRDGTLTEAGKKRYYDAKTGNPDYEKVRKDLGDKAARKLAKANQNAKNSEALREHADQNGKGSEPSQTNPHQNEKSLDKYTNKKTDISRLTTDELQKVIDRLVLEKRYNDLMKELHPSHPSKASELARNVGQAFIEKLGEKMTKRITEIMAGKDVDGKMLDELSKKEGIEVSKYNAELARARLKALKEGKLDPTKAQPLSGGPKNKKGG